jgi:hypothetical protein
MDLIKLIIWYMSSTVVISTDVLSVSQIETKSAKDPIKPWGNYIRKQWIEKG